jgi:hypothetical protein
MERDYLEGEGKRWEKRQGEGERKEGDEES